MKLSKETRQKMSEAKIGDKNPRAMLGKHHTKETRKLISEARSKYLTYNNKTLSVKEWAEEIGISHISLSKRLKNGWSIKRALTTKLNKTGVWILDMVLKHIGWGGLQNEWKGTSEKS